MLVSNHKPEPKIIQDLPWWRQERTGPRGIVAASLSSSPICRVFPRSGPFPATRAPPPPSAWRWPGKRVEPASMPPCSNGPEQPLLGSWVELPPYRPVASYPSPAKRSPRRTFLDGALQPFELFELLLVLYLTGLGGVQLLVEALVRYE